MAEVTRQLNIRIPESLIEELERIATEEHVDRTSITRKLLVEGVQRWRLERALHLYEQGQITKERAAEMAGVSIYDILDALRQRGTLAQYSLEELREDLALLQQRYSGK
jgi:predicted HTH domain antitoxin